MVWPGRRCRRATAEAKPGHRKPGAQTGTSNQAVKPTSLSVLVEIYAYRLKETRRFRFVMPVSWGNVGIHQVSVLMEGEVAQRVQIILEDDFDGGEADETVSFALDGAEYEIDLSTDNAADLRNALAPWLGHARKVGGRRRSRPASRSSANDSGGSTSDMRAWAVANGMEVSSRGRISGEVREAYEQAHA